MKRNKEKDIIIEEKPVEKVCKKCGAPLRSTSKHKYCEHCRRERIKTRKEVLGVIIGLSLIPSVKHFLNKK